MDQTRWFYKTFKTPAASWKILAGAALLAGSFSFSVSAEPVRLKSIKSSVQVKRAKTPDKWYTARPGLVLNPGDAIRTGDKAQAQLTLADGTKMVLRPKTQMQVRETAPNRVFGLDFGRMKSFVKKLKSNNKFEVKTPVAAASVRGTVFEVGYDPEQRSGFLDVSEGAVALAQEGREALVGAGERLDFMSDRPLGEPIPRGSDAGGAGTEAQANVRREVGLGMSKEDIMAAAAEEMRLAEYQEGKTLIDVHGQRVRLEEYIIRKPREVAEIDRDKAFKLVVLNERDNRLDYFYYRGIFNTTLPDNLSLAFQDINGKLGAERPTYFLREYEMGQSNTQDFIKDNASGGHLVKITFDGSDYTLTDADDPTNTRTVAGDEVTVAGGVTYHKIYDPINDRFTTITDDQYQAGDYRPAVYDPADDNFRLFDSGDTYWRTRYNNYSHVLNDVAKQSYAKKSSVASTLAVDLDADWTYAGGSMITTFETPSGQDLFHHRVTLYYGDGTKESYDTYVISDEGRIASVSDFSNVTTGKEFKQELLKWNYQQVATASEFQGRKIDLVVEPKILIKAGIIK
jgi:hypothetical protein